MEGPPPCLGVHGTGWWYVCVCTPGMPLSVLDLRGVSEKEVVKEEEENHINSIFQVASVL